MLQTLLYNKDLKQIFQMPSPSYKDISGLTKILRQNSKTSMKSKDFKKVQTLLVKKKWDLSWTKKLNI